MKGNLTLLMLELLGRGPVGSYDLAEQFFKFEYGTAHRELSRGIGKKPAAARMRSRYNNFLYKLVSEELISEERNGDRKRFRMTEKGRAKLTELRRRKAFPDIKSYAREGGAGITVVVFGIPESERAKRDWLRGVLKYLEFRMVQRGVWAGKNRVPLELLHDLRELGFLKYVDIFQAKGLDNLKQFAPLK